MQSNSSSLERTCPRCKKTFKVAYPCRPNRFCSKSCASRKHDVGDVPGCRRCSVCGITKLSFEFFSQYSYCKRCSIAKSRKWKRENAERAKEIGRNDNLRRMYGITLDEYKAIFDRQGGVCAICHQPETDTQQRNGRVIYRTLAVDHCHTANAIRSLLCAKCNRGIGMFRDSADLLRAAADYLDRHSISTRSGSPQFLSP